MDFDTLWIIIEKQNTTINNSNENITMSKRGFKKALKLAFDKGRECEKEFQKSYVNKDYKKDPKRTHYEGNDIFNTIFGKNDTTNVRDNYW